MEGFQIESLDGTPDHRKFSKKEFLDMNAVEEVTGKYMYLYNKDIPKEYDSVKVICKAGFFFGAIIYGIFR